MSAQTPEGARAASAGSAAPVRAAGRRYLLDTDIVGAAIRGQEFVLRADVLPWDDAVARCYGACRAAWEAAGLGLADLDMMIAAHAVHAGAVLVSRAHAFGHVAQRPPVPDAGRLSLEVW